MKAINTYKNLSRVDDIPAVKSGLEALEINDLLVGGLLGNNLAQAMFTNLIEYDEGFKFLLNTPMSKMLRAMRDATNNGENTPIWNRDDEDNLVLENIPKMSFSPMTSNPDDCCVIAGDLQVCKDATILKALCIEKCQSGIDRMAAAIGVAGKNSVVYAAYTQMLKAEGINKSSLPTIEQFEQLSLIAQFIVLNMLTFINGMLEVEQNGNIIKRFNGLAQVMSQPDVFTVDGGSGVIAAFDELLCRIDIIGATNFVGAAFIASRPAMSKIKREIVPKRDGNYPAGWDVVSTNQTINGQTVPSKKYFFNGIPIIQSELVYIDTETMQGDIYLVSPNTGIFSAIPLDMPASFLMQEWDKAHSPFVHWSEDSVEYPDCWTNCVSLTNFGAVVNTDVNGLAVITGLDSGCDAEVYKGLEGLFNINSYAPFVR